MLQTSITGTYYVYVKNTKKRQKVYNHARGPVSLQCLLHQKMKLDGL